MRACLILLAVLLPALATPDAGRRPDVPAADEGGGIVVIDELENLFGPVLFDHAGHARMSQLAGGCANCHHQQGGLTARVLPCRQCHTRADTASTFEMPGLKAAYHRQCLACHRDWSGANSCGFCHGEIAGGTPPVPYDPTDIVGVPHPRLEGTPTMVFETPLPGAPWVTFHHVDHVERFGLACVDCHRESSCKGCHGSDSPAVRTPIHRQQRCFSCHDGMQCWLCHDETPRPRFDHGRRSGWSLGPHHASLACTECHGAASGFRVPSATSCDSCHARANAPNFDHAATGVPLAGSHARFECVRCHAHGGRDWTPTCTGCHPDRSYPRQWPGLATPPTTALTTDPAHFDHATTGVVLTGSHATFACTLCHDEADPDAPPTCSGCHPDRHYPENWPGLATPPDEGGVVHRSTMKLLQKGAIDVKPRRQGGHRDRGQQRDRRGHGG